MKRELYSIVVYPSAQVIGDIAQMKEELFYEIGWYHSRNSKAHITVCEFLASPAEAAIVLDYVKSFCVNSAKQDVSFPNIHAFHTTCFVAPDDASRQYFRNLFKLFKKSFPFDRKLFEVKFSSEAHISVGRLLDAFQIASAATLFGERKSGLNFKAEALTLRKFDTDTRQFADLAEFKFKTECIFGSIDYQLSLF